MTAPLDPIRTELAEALEAALDDAYGYSSYRWPQQEDCPRIADALLRSDAVARLRAEAAAEALEAAFREDRTTVAQLGPVERLTCYLVKSEDLVARAAVFRSAALSAVTSREPS